MVAGGEACAWGWLDRGDYYPPVGRFRVDFEEARQHLVEHARFEESTRRAGIWEGLERYLALFLALEDRYSAELGGEPLVRSLWVSGSFVSGKVEPDNMDLSVLVDDQSRGTLKGKPGSAWLNTAFKREHCKREFGLSTLEIPYRAIPSAFRSHLLEPPEQTYLRERGAWDDWWQRCRDDTLADQGPTLETCQPARGYLEVTL